MFVQIQYYLLSLVIIILLTIFLISCFIYRSRLAKYIARELFVQ